MELDLKHILKLRDEVLKSLNGKVGDFFLGGGTALSLFYLHHRESYDLDFFTKNFSEKRIEAIISEIENSLDVKTISEEEVISKNRAKILRCFIPVSDKKLLDAHENKNSLKIDFLEDVYYDDIPSREIIIDGIPILSQENIYLRKIYTLCGVLETQNNTGRKRFVGGRQEAKNLFDLYYLSKDFMRLSKFVAKYCPNEKEKIITWYSSYKREEMKLGINELIIKKEADFHNIERHLKLEIEDMIKQEL
jgi:hypothetical protein